MSLRSLQFHPATFWVLTVLTFFGTGFGIWSHVKNQPSRQLSYYIDHVVFGSLDKAHGLSLPVQGERSSTGDISVVTFSVWNSGNQDIEEDDFLRPLVLSLDVPWQEHRMSFHGLDESQAIGSLKQGLRFKSLYPGSGIRVSFFSRSTPTSTLTGNINGGLTGNSGLYDVNELINNIGFVVLTLAILLWLLISYPFFYSWRKKQTSLGDFLWTSFMSLVLASFVASVLFGVCKFVLGPPF
jgi:hypothetical protein